MFGTRYYYGAARSVGGKRLRAALLASTALVRATMLPATAQAQDATWLANPGSGDFFVGSNWNGGNVPGGTATFGTSATTALTLGSAGFFDGWTFSAGASDYTFTVGAAQAFAGVGIVINGGSATIINNDAVQFSFNSTAGSAVIVNNNTLQFSHDSTAGNATITNNNMEFLNASTAGNAGITNVGTLNFFNSSTAGSATIANTTGALNFDYTSTAGNATIVNTTGTLDFYADSSAGNATITNQFIARFNGNSTAGNAAITNNGFLGFFGTSTAGSAAIVNNNSLAFYEFSTAGSATITNNGGLQFFGSTNAGSATITNSGSLVFFNSSNAGNATLINNAGGVVDFSSTAGLNNDEKLSAGSIAGAGSYVLGTNELTVGSNNLSTEVSGVISGTGSLVKTGTGTLTLSGTNTYSGGTTINGGTLQLGAVGAVGSILGTVTVDSGGAFGVVNADTSGITSIMNSGSTFFLNSNSAGSATINNFGLLNFNNSSTAGSAAITNNGSLSFNDASTAGDAAITNSGILQTADTGSLGNATITNNAYLYLQNNSTAGSATITNNQTIFFYYSSTAGTATITNNSSLNFGSDSSAGSAHITNNSGGGLSFYNASTAGSATITNSGGLEFYHTSTAGNAAITNNSGGGLSFYNASTAGSATITNNYGIGFYDTSTAGNAAITNNSGGTLGFNNASSAGSATITNSGNLAFGSTSTAGNANITNNNNLIFYGTAGSATITNNTGGSTFFRDSSDGGSARFTNNAGSTFDISGLTASGTAAGSIEGAGSYRLGGKTLTVGGNNLSTTVSGVIADGGTSGGTGGSLVKTGAGTLTLTGSNTYSGGTTISGGTLAVNGSILSSSGVTVNAGGTLGGTGTVGNTTIMSGGNLAAGNSIGTLSINGNLTFNAGGIYTVEVSPSAADRTNVTGSATLTGATVQAVALMPASFKAQTYTILNASGGLGGTQFAGLDVIGSFRPGARNPHLTYDANNVYLVLDPGEIILPSGTNGNQSSVAAGINRAVLGGATPPAAFDVLLNLDGTPLKNALAQISGETATGAQQSTFNAMTMFLGQMTDPFVDGRGDMAASVPGSVSSYAAAGAARRAAVARDAFAAITPAAPISFEQRWSVWAGGYGGGQTTDGNAVTGTGTATSRIFGGIGGADYRLSPDTLVGFALAGGGTSFSVTNGGSSRADLFQAGAFVRHHNGPAYLSAALAYGWQDVTTDRTVTIAGIDRLQARFQANTFAGRVEGGYRFATPWMGITPYTAGQVTSFQLPAYAESVLSGANTFALSYGAKTVTASRSELGLRTDKSWAVNDAILTLRGRAAWAHDFNPDRAAAATFQTLPGASFVVNGAVQARDSALATASAEVTWRNGFSLGATLEGEFSSVTRSYGGKGIVRYVW